ncbi:uncharacterized protein [Euwallacea fornicatus]|uniref:uncharacterized protein n=1 Tax=Euwallacea fornicatus TaxID=995702 RepID=UPI00338E2CC4
MPRRPRQEDIYWSAAESESDESIKKQQTYIDPWDLENYAYIREHLDSMELSSNPSVPVSGSSAGSGGDLGEANSHSFFYVPGTKRLSDRHQEVISGDYADIEEVEYMSRRPRNRRKSGYYEYDDESAYEYGLKDNSVFGIYDQAGRFRKVSVPVSTIHKPLLERSLSSPRYGDYYEYDPYATRQEIYSRLEDMSYTGDRTMPIYDDVRRLRRKPQNFGLTNYGHLKIDYSISWNDLNKYMRYNS